MKFMTMDKNMTIGKKNVFVSVTQSSMIDMTTNLVLHVNIFAMFWCNVINVGILSSGLS